MNKIIFDTDIGGDCDDMGALAMVHRAVSRGLAELAAVSLSTSSPYAAGCADAVNRWYGHIVPIGQTETAPPGDDPAFFPSSYGRHISDMYENSYGTEKPESALRLLRRTLASAENGEVTLIVIGACTNLATLLASGGDDISPLSGIELVASKVREVSLMGCYFPSPEFPDIWLGDYHMEAEFNIKADIPAAQTVFTCCPVPVVLSHYTIGLNIRTGGILIKKERKNPVAEAYYVHSRGDRESWDPVSAYYALFGADGYFTLSQPGTVRIDASGRSVFTDNPKGLHRLIYCPSFERAKERIDAVMRGEF